MFVEFYSGKACTYMQPTYSFVFTCINLSLLSINFYYTIINSIFLKKNITVEILIISRYQINQLFMNFELPCLNYIHFTNVLSNNTHQHPMLLPTPGIWHFFYF